VIGGLTQAWSLSVEAAFYVMLPLYALAMRSLPLDGDRRFRAELAGLALLVAIGVGITTYAAETGITAGRLDIVPLHLTLPSFLHVFAAGMCLAVLSVWYEERDDLPAWLRPLDRFPGIAWGVALLAFWVVSTQIGLDGASDESQSTAQWVGRSALYALVGLAVVIPAVFGDQARGLVRRILANRVLLWIGLVSYSFFLYHLAVVIQVDRWELPASVPVALVLSLAIAAASYHLIERPALSLKRLVKDTRRPPPGEAIEEPAPPAPPAQARA
jgi:peptidoglycan/LPS O-acetylase OafA/YrhL